MGENLVLAGVNAQYVHTALAVRQLAAVLHAAGRPCDVAEYTINQHPADILRDLALRRADAYLFSCYIWNVGLVRQVAADLRRVCPGALLVAGGPQAAHCAETFLRDNPAFNAVATGEGEGNIVLLADAAAGRIALGECPGLVYREGDSFVATPDAPLPAMDGLPFAYDDLDALGGRILYYESMRGCPYRCSYCLSGRDGAVRAKSLETVYAELDRFLAARVRQVKFVDRTFNCDAPRALAIWRYLAAHDNNVTGFHFEMAGHLLNEEALDFLSTVREGLFQFEIGVQSTNPDTLAAIHRGAGLARCLQNAKDLRRAGNVHLHLDLIAGLPFEDAGSFARSFDEVYAARPHQLQLGFLKMLPGSEMERRAAEYGLVCQQEAPFEILCNRWLTFEELCQLKDMAAMVELYHNSGRFTHVVGRLCGGWASPFAFYRALAALWRRQGYHKAPLSKLGQYQLLGDFAQPPDEELQYLCRLDMALHEKPRVLPAWVQVDGSRPHRNRVLAFYQTPGNVETCLPNHRQYEPKQLLKMAHVEVLPFDPATGQLGECALLFDYTRRDVTGKALCRRITLPK